MANPSGVLYEQEVFKMFAHTAQLVLNAVIFTEHI